MKKRGFCPKSAREMQTLPVKILVKFHPWKKIGAREKFWAIFPAKMITFLINSARETDLCTREENGKKPKKVPVKTICHAWKKWKKWAKMAFTGTFDFHGEKKNTENHTPTAVLRFSKFGSRFAVSVYLPKSHYRKWNRNRSKNRHQKPLRFYLRYFFGKHLRLRLQ